MPHKETENAMIDRKQLHQDGYALSAKRSRPSGWMACVPCSMPG
ncbi:hypothetical protein SAMN05216504_4173 [Pseudomonas sp. A214]|jgi:hypothetical protein|nr:hypothetical protein SAMN05216504_4173 [Pseudomonas sp. A214]